MERAIKSSKERHKACSNIEQNTPLIDRLSSLPDEVILHILSFLSTKLSAGTSVLARRWRFLWAHVPNLDFYFGYCTEVTSSLSIVNRVMSLHKAQSLNTFRLEYDEICAYEFETCIATAIERNVRILDLALIVDMPQSFLTCKCLVDLTMRSGVCIPFGGAISLPSLKRLHFCCLYSDVRLPQLLSGCPVLEELIAEGNPYDSSGCCNIYSLTLKRLTFDFLLDRDVYDKYEYDYRVKINAPALRYFKVSEFSCDHFSISPTTSLIEADICLDYCSNEISDPSWALKLLDSFCNLKCLTLSGRYEYPDLGVAGSYVRFEKLTKLDLGISVDYRFLIKFLENADHLEVLILRQVPYIPRKWMENMEERCACLLHSLRTVTIHGFCCTRQHEFNMVRYILKNAQVLKRMQIFCQRYVTDWKAKFGALRRISLFHRGSKECEVAFF